MCRFRSVIFALLILVAGVLPFQAVAHDCAKDKADAIATISRNYDFALLRIEDLKGLKGQLGKLADPHRDATYRKAIRGFGKLVLRRPEDVTKVERLAETCDAAARSKIRDIASSYETATNELAASILVFSIQNRTLRRSSPTLYAMESPSFGFASSEKPVDTNTAISAAAAPKKQKLLSRSLRYGSADVVDLAEAEDAVKATGKPTADADIDAEIKKLIEGHVVFNNPTQMRMARPYTIQAVLSKTLSVPALKTHLLDQVSVDSAGLLVGKRMRVTLNGGSAFDISPPGPQTQWVTDSAGPTTWTWSITPKLDGKQVLILTFDAVLKVDGSDDFRNITTLKREIEVDVGWPSSFSEWIAYLKKALEDFKFLWMAILVPIGGWLIARWRKRNATPTPPSGGEPAA